MDQEMMKFKEELQELVHKGQELLQMMQGGSFGQRRRYGRRDNNGGNYSNGNYGQREQPWMHGQPGPYGPHGGYDQSWEDMDPRYFM